MRSLLIFLCYACFFCSCGGEATIPTEKAQVADSFFMIGAEDVSEVVYAQAVNDATLETFSRADKAIKTFRKKGNDFFVAESIPVAPGGHYASYYRLSEDSFLVLDFNGPLYLKRLSGTGRIYPNDKKEHLSDFILGFPYSHKPFVYKGDLYSTYYHRDVAEYEQTFKEPVLAQYRIKGDSLLFIKSHIERPAGLQDLRQPYPLFTFNERNKQLVLMYAPFDHIELYDLEQEKMLRKMDIGNKFYSRPAKYSFEKIFGTDGMSYDQNYYMDNFSYESILYLEAAKKYILFFLAPGSEGRKEEKFMGLVLNDKFEKEKYLSFDTRHFRSDKVVTFSDGSFAMPVYYNHQIMNSEKVKFIRYRL